MASVEHCLYCFETLTANLEKRQPMSLYQVQNSWADYPKGLEDEEDHPSSPEITHNSPPSITSKPRVPTLARLSARAASGTSTPVSSSSSSSLSPATDATTPSSSNEKFTPIGIGRRTSQRPSIVESPLFVTWNTVSRRSGSRSLRGCIGTFEALPISTGLSSYSLTSALSDHRFSPITLSELPSLEVAVTLLTDFEDAKDAMDWELGVHGIRISFYARNKRYGACYLPDVAVEQGWDKEETIISLMRKAGWSGRTEKWNEVGDFKVVRFQGMAETVGWGEYRAWREWVKRGGK